MHVWVSIKDMTTVNVRAYVCLLVPMLGAIHLANHLTLVHTFCQHHTAHGWPQLGPNPKIVSFSLKINQLLKNPIFHKQD